MGKTVRKPAMLYDRGQGYEETMRSADKKGKRKVSSNGNMVYVHKPREKDTIIAMQTLHIIMTLFTDKTCKHCELLSHCACHAILSTAHIPNRRFYLTSQRRLYAGWLMRLSYEKRLGICCMYVH